MPRVLPDTLVGKGDVSEGGKSIETRKPQPPTSSVTGQQSFDVCATVPRTCQAWGALEIRTGVDRVVC